MAALLMATLLWGAALHCWEVALAREALVGEALAGEPPVLEVVWEEVADKNGDYSYIFFAKDRFA